MGSRREGGPWPHTVERGIDDVALLAAGPYPSGFDLDGALDLCRRGLYRDGRRALAMKEVRPSDLDCHAHIAPDVTSEQLRELGNVLVLAMTRTLDEAEAVSRRDDPQRLWGCGVHPAVRSARDSFDVTRFRSLLPDSLS
jgi:hypothetical protein